MLHASLLLSMRVVFEHPAGFHAAAQHNTGPPGFNLAAQQATVVCCKTDPVREKPVSHKPKLGFDRQQAGTADFPGFSWRGRPTCCDPCEFLRKQRRSKTSTPPLSMLFFCFAFIAFLLHDAPPSSACSPQALITASAPSACVLLSHSRASFGVLVGIV